ncbi:MAG: hypothetical protein K0A94_03150 [Desulfuromonadales bacterium]|nr:hypothetical protein [Desulfuromonadales bacterium]
MSGRLALVDNLCRNPENHQRHLCELKAAGRYDEIERLVVAPRFICGNCGSKANEAGAVCAPGPWQE